MAKNIWGKELKKDKKARIKSYLKDSLIFTIIMSALYVLGIFISPNKAVFELSDSYTMNFILTILITMIILFAISYLYNYILSERKFKGKKK